jgi:hypothetical protein
VREDLNAPRLLQLYDPNFLLENYSKIGEKKENSTMGTVNLRTMETQIRILGGKNVREKD